MVNGFKKKAVESVFFEGISNGIRQGINFIVIITLARLLAPQYFGVITLISLIINISIIIKEVGLAVGIIQKDKINDENLTTAFYLNLVIGVVFFAFIPRLLSGFSDSSFWIWQVPCLHPDFYWLIQMRQCKIF